MSRDRREWYYCLKHEAVEPYDGCRGADRLGPYATKEDAALALETVRQRNEAWSEGDDRDEEYER